MLVMLKEPKAFKLRASDTRLTTPLATFEGKEGTYQLMRLDGRGFKLLKANGYAVRTDAVFVPYEPRYVWPPEVLSAAAQMLGVPVKKETAKKVAAKPVEKKKPVAKKSVKKAPKKSK